MLEARPSRTRWYQVYGCSSSTFFSIMSGKTVHFGHNSVFFHLLITMEVYGASRGPLGAWGVFIKKSWLSSEWKLHVLRADKIRHVLRVHLCMSGQNWGRGSHLFGGTGLSRIYSGKLECGPDFEWGFWGVCFSWNYVAMVTRIAYKNHARRGISIPHVLTPYLSQSDKPFRSFNWKKKKNNKKKREQ